MTTATTDATTIVSGHMADIQIVDLAKSYGVDEQAVLAMSDVTLNVASGEFVAVVGASGCGKSTLLRILAGFEKPTNGIIRVGGAPIVGPGSDRGVVFQDYGLFPWLTARENVMYGPRQRRASRREAIESSEG